MRTKTSRAAIENLLKFMNEQNAYKHEKKRGNWRKSQRKLKISKKGVDKRQNL